ncbi:T6SS immunity protein Tdi1 domain-containing protein [Sinomonas albida]|uniref:T6SS immunity protein Tdi1 domain-containing protein n=1 Tax=Sinomonas albida TaxID=369942 RepID=UPI0010A91119|nr:T6SS immunity protein Tdi1 domain-containing protein [Sinomonas albida]
MKMFGRKRAGIPASLYFLFDGAVPLEDGDGVKVGDAFTHAIGYSALGHVFVVNESSMEFGVYHPFKAASKNYGPFDSVQAFQAAVLEDEGFRVFVLEPDLQAQVVGRLGQLGDGEVFYPVPYPFVGGSGEPQTYDKGKFWTFLQVVDAMQG